jgi:hypothetical protein
MDRLLIGSILLTDGLKHRLSALAIRLFLALLIGFAVSHTFALKAFESEISTELTKEKIAGTAELKKKAGESGRLIDEYDKKIEKIDADLTTLAKSNSQVDFLTTKTEDINRLERDKAEVEKKFAEAVKDKKYTISVFVCECGPDFSRTFFSGLGMPPHSFSSSTCDKLYGKNEFSGTAGFGPKCGVAQTRLNEAIVKENDFRSNISQLQSTIDVRNKEQFDPSEHWRQKKSLLDEKGRIINKRKTEVDEQTGYRNDAAGLDPQGYLARSRVLIKMFSEQREARLVILGIVAIILVIELGPILAKIMSRSGHYESLMSINNLLTSAVLETIQKGWIDIAATQIVVGSNPLFAPDINQIFVEKPVAAVESNYSQTGVPYTKKSGAATRLYVMATVTVCIAFCVVMWMSLAVKESFNTSLSLAATVGAFLFPVLWGAVSVFLKFHRGLDTGNA